MAIGASKSSMGRVAKHRAHFRDISSPTHRRQRCCLCRASPPGFACSVSPGADGRRPGGVLNQTLRQHGAHLCLCKLSARKGVLDLLPFATMADGILHGWGLALSQSRCFAVLFVATGGLSRQIRPDAFPRLVFKGVVSPDLLALGARGVGHAGFCNCTPI